MKTKSLSLSVLLITAFLLTACGPSAEQIATMTASAWTPTPRPTPTPTATPTATPIPYDLTVKVTDADGNPIAGANVAFPESGDDAPVSTDDSGQVTWSSLGGPNGALTVAAPGYFGAEQSVSLERGPNEVVVALERDPYGLLPSVACAPEEKSLYIEDFQDGQAQGWQAITAATEFGANNGWGLGPKEEGNQVVFFTGINESSNDLDGYTFENAVWRIKVQVVGKDGFSFLNWRHAPAEGGDTRYPFQWGGEGFMDLTRLSPEAGHFSVDRSNLLTKPGRWYFIEISSYEGLFQVWVDGKMKMEYRDPKPLPAGTIGLEAHIWKDANTIYYFDDLSVCELSAPFANSLFVPPAQ